MPMVGTSLGAQIKSALLGTGLANDDPMMDTICNAIGTAVVDYIVANATVLVNAGIAVQVVPATGTGATTAPGTGSIS